MIFAESKEEAHRRIISILAELEWVPKKLLNSNETAGTREYNDFLKSEWQELRSRFQDLQDSNKEKFLERFNAIEKVFESTTSAKE